MIRWLHRLFRPPADVRQEATVLLAMHGTEGAWLAARNRRRAAAEHIDWLWNPELRYRSRYWNRVVREIERQTGYLHQPDRATRMIDLDPAGQSYSPVPLQRDGEID